jgi:hypothetical protein
VSPRALPLLAALAWCACGAGPAETRPDATGFADDDAGTQSADASASLPSDAGLPDAAEGAGPDASRADTGFRPDPACGYASTATHLASCGGAYTGIDTMAPGRVSLGCLAWFRGDGQAFPSFPAALAGLGCDPSCVWTALSSGLIVWCNAKGELTQFAPGGPGQTGADGGCASVVYVDTIAGSGYAPTLDAFEQAHPCK